MTLFDVFAISNAGLPFGREKPDYACFERLAKRHGIYVFKRNSSSQVLYVGQAPTQDLKTRICQNYTEGDAGGTFRKNYCAIEGKSFSDFKELLRNSSLSVMMIETEMKPLIAAIEAILIAALKPMYNR